MAGVGETSLKKNSRVVKVQSVVLGGLRTRLCSW